MSMDLGLRETDQIAVADDDVVVVSAEPARRRGRIRVLLGLLRLLLLHC
jgi:hypothetical protein